MTIENKNSCSASDDKAAKLLELHFSYIAKPVTCNAVKSFLPGLADSISEIREPTPITAHIDNCQECADELRKIRKFHLTTNQLCRLERFLADKSIKKSNACSEAQKAIPFIARLDFEGLPADILKHVCLCHSCQSELSDLRNAHIQRISKIENPQPFACSEIMARDIFDFAVPYGLELQNHQNTNPNRLFIAHIARCADCFKKLLDLQKQIFEIFNRPDSGVTTKTNIDTSNETNKNGSNALPILVEVTHKINPWRKIEKQFTSTSLKRLIKPAAAVLLFALALYIFTIPTAHAIALEDIYSAVAKVTNVHILSFVPDKNEPIRQQWISESLKISIIKTPEQIVAWDLGSHIKKTKIFATGDIDTNSFSNGTALKLNKVMSNTAGLLPFSKLTDIPQNSKWEQVTNDVNGMQNVKIYDLTWTETAEGNLVRYKKWRGFLDVKTDLPQRIEWFENPDETRFIYVEIIFYNQYPT